jgi:hypothetical protein
MRVLGLALAGRFAVTAALAAHAVPLGSNMGRLATVAAPGIVQAWAGCGWGWHPVPGHWSQWRGGWVLPHCAPNRYYGGGPYWGSGGSYGAWGAPYGAGSRPDGGWQPYAGGWSNR